MKGGFMRYAIQRYDDVFGTTETTMICNDVYFNREENTFYGSGFSSIEDCVNAVISFIGSDDAFNINNLRFIPVGDSPFYDIAEQIANVFHLIPYNGIAYDNEWHSITGIIKIEDKTTTFVDWGSVDVARLPDDGRGYYRGGSWSSNPGGYNLTPWWFSTSVASWLYNSLSGIATVQIQFAVLPENVVNDGVINIPSDCKITQVNVTISANNISTLTGNPAGYSVEVRIFDESTVPEVVRTLLNNEESSQQDDPNNDPYSSNTETGGQSGTGGGHYSPTQPPTGTYSPASDSNPIPNLPSVAATDTGFITLFNPDESQLRNLASYMWGSLFDITTWKKVVADPMDCILGLSIVPVNVPISGAESVKVGNIPTGITMYKASSQFVELDCGSISIKEYWKCYLDYSPYTKLNIFLPYVGAYELNIDDIQVNTVGVKYHIDILSGACVAFITAGGNVIAQYSGQCAISIPITSKDFTQTLIALGTLVAGGAATVMTGGLSAPITASSVAGAVTAAANTAANVISSKPTISKSGNMGGSNGLMGVQKPYLFISRPKQCAPKNQNRYTGYPSYITEKLSNLTGFTQIQDIRLDGIKCTEEERNEILELLRTGVIL